MSVVVAVSYQQDDELSLILDRLEDLNLSVSGAEYKSGRFRRCYLKSRKHLSTINSRGEPVEDHITEYPSA